MRVRAIATTAAAAGLMAGALTVTSSVADDDGSAERGADLRSALEDGTADLITPFEASNGKNWTTVDQSLRFHRQLDGESDRVTLERAGRSGDGRPLQLVTVGADDSDQRDTADDSVAMFNCSIHGNEPAGREACMQLSRDLAFSDDPAVERFLSHTTAVFLYPNPDGWEANTRGNAEGVDINRDMLGLETPEGQAIARTIRDRKPDILNDLHEYGEGKYYNDHALVLWPRNRNVDDTIHDFSQQMVLDYATPQVESNDGYTAGIYGVLVKDGEPFQQIAGDHQARILRNYTGLQHVTGMLTETATGALTPEEESDPALRNRRRAQVEYSSAVGTVQMVMERRDQLAEQSTAAAERATQKGASQDGVVYFGGQDNKVPTEDEQVEPEPMCGYQLTGDQLGEVRRTLRLHGITWKRNNQGAYVTMAQPDQPIIPLLLDKRSEYGIMDATPISSC
ncbi:MAG TPA: M14 family zinc carboxypeptidase [Nocardioidaceae bacterium]|nr:M14 family zinc carboxypeptidase [Nocardioidaceae bacterium]